MKALEIEAKIILCDIEGTTTSISFVKDILFTYAKDNVEEFLQEKGKDENIKSILNELQQLSEYSDYQSSKQDNEVSASTMACFIKHLIEKDLKLPPLKRLQGLIWENGYNQKTLKGHVYDDVRPSFDKWTKAGHCICIFSSGSVHAQKLLFKHSIQGDLTKYITNYFDTEIGNKREPEAYANIAAKLDVQPKEILFLTDIAEEAAAAKKSGMKTVILYRPGNCLSDEERTRNLVVQHFDELQLLRFKNK